MSVPRRLTDPDALSESVSNSSTEIFYETGQTVKRTRERRRHGSTTEIRRTSRSSTPSISSRRKRRSRRVNHDKRRHSRSLTPYEKRFSTLTEKSGSSTEMRRTSKCLTPSISSRNPQSGPKRKEGKTNPIHEGSNAL